jgi:hypothetical protein
MKDVYFIAYRVSESGGFGEGSMSHTAIWKAAGVFKSERDAQNWLLLRENDLLYIASNPFVEKISLCL